MNGTVKIGTRDSQLARWQTDYVLSLLKAVDPSLSVTIVPIKTTADIINTTPLEKIGSTGVFTKEIEKALLENSIDIAVHSMKDLETVLPEGLTIGAVPVREDSHDALIAKQASTLDELPQGATILTGSPRRKALLLHYRPDFHIGTIRGNIDTRIKKLHNSNADALILAAAGLKRLALSEHISSIISEDILLPAIGQGALAIQVRSDDKKLLKLCSKINNTTFQAVTAAERSFLRRIQGGCQIPAGCIGTIKDNFLVLTGVIAMADGSRLVRESYRGDPDDPENTGVRLAETILDKGGSEILDNFRSGISGEI
jgi:hydroxymethylbilane synthase